MILPIKGILVFAVSGLFLAEVAPAANVVDSAGRLTLDAALVLAVVALWKAVGAKDTRIAEKDAQIVAMASRTTDTMMSIAAKQAETTVTVVEAVKELRMAVSSLKLSFDDLPCSVREDERHKDHRR